MEKLLRILSVADYRSMRGWSPPADLRPFATYNVIYGANGTGKTTLAALMRDFASEEDGTGLRVLVGADATNSRTVARSSDQFWKSVRVFNTDYVAANLRFEDARGSSAEPLLVLGEERVGVERERDDALAGIAKIDEKLPEVERAKRTATAARDKLLTDTARTIAEELQGVTPRYSMRSYRAPQVQAVLDRASAPTKEPIDISQELRIAQGPELSECMGPNPSELDATSIVEGVRALLEQTARSVVIDELAEHPEWSRWVGRGMELHEHRDSCLYCGSALSPERREQLDAHFDESLKRLEGGLARGESEVNEFRATVGRVVSDLPDPAAIVETMRDDYERRLNEVQGRQEELVAYLDHLVTALEGKRDRLFESVALAGKPTKLSLVEIAAIIDQHNGFVKDAVAHRTAAAARVEHARVAAIEDAFRAAAATAIEKETEATRLRSERKTFEAAIARAKSVELDPNPMAERLNTDLAQLLGRDDLSFIPYERGYRILRGGVPALHLSEGERNAISLLYFLGSLLTHDTDCATSVVVIDDPVSSLDQNNLLAASALLWSRLIQQCGQLIVLTHNFEFFRTWCYQLEAAKSKLQKGDKQYYSLYEMQVRVAAEEGDAFRREPRIVAWPTDYFMQKRLRSEYHYLFWTAAKMLSELDANPTPETEMEAAAMLPNVCRRLLESFLAFHHPGALGSLNEQVNSVEAEGLDKDVRTRVLRFVHTYSHSENVDFGRPLSRPDTLVNIRAVLSFMKAIDPRHVKSMCDALEVTV